METKPKQSKSRAAGKGAQPAFVLRVAPAKQIAWSGC
jgi:hypothetical protein